MAVLSFFGECVTGGTLNGIKNTMSLQVRCIPPFKMIRWHEPGKRVQPFTSRRNYRASMTVEAAMVLPLFLFFAMALLLPMQMMDEQRKRQMKMEMTCETLSLFAYLEETSGLDELPEADEWLPEDGIGSENIVLKTVYYEPMPFFSRWFNGISLEVAAKRRQWRGYRGKLKKSDRENIEIYEEEMVYVGKGMGRYHRDRNCHYITNAYQAVSMEEAMNMRDADGHKFSACASCKNMIRENGTVYITGSGRHYHGDTECRSMVSYARKVPLSEVEHLGPCSYCSGDGN